MMFKTGGITERAGRLCPGGEPAFSVTPAAADRLTASAAPRAQSRPNLGIAVDRPAAGAGRRVGHRRAVHRAYHQPGGVNCAGRSASGPNFMVSGPGGHRCLPVRVNRADGGGVYGPGFDRHSVAFLDSRCGEAAWQAWSRYPKDPMPLSSVERPLYGPRAASPFATAR